jgi:signal peptidase II
MRYRRLLTVAVIVAAADLLTKVIAAALFSRASAQLPGHWTLHMVRNHGVILGLGAGTELPNIFAVLTAIQLATLLWVNRRQHGPAWAVAIGLLLGAAVGNVGESRLTGCAIDWIEPPSLPIVFNLADVACVTGQILLITLAVLRARGGRVRARTAVAR